VVAVVVVTQQEVVDVGVMKLVANRRKVLLQRLVVEMGVSALHRRGKGFHTPVLYFAATNQHSGEATQTQAQAQSAKHQTRKRATTQ